MKNHIIIFIILLSFAKATSQINEISLSGTWNFALDSLDIGEKNEWFKKQFTSKITLPGTTDQGNYGERHVDGTLLYDGKPEIYRLARKHVYIGAAWYQKEFDIPAEWRNKKVTLKLERCMWKTSLWINNEFVGDQTSLSVAHNFELTRFLKSGKNKIVLRIDNRPYVHLGSWSHGYSPELQSIWNGAIGEISLKAVEKIHIKNVKISPSVDKQELAVNFRIDCAESLNNKGVITFNIVDLENENTIIDHKIEINKKDTTNTYLIKIPLNNKLSSWDEFNPQLYNLNISGIINDINISPVDETFGLRKIEINNNRIVINGNTTFFRGEHGGGLTPITGHPSMLKADWLRIFRIGRSYGLNHWRFHSWCPPKAAFEAADELGIYLQPELPLFSQNWENTLVGQDDRRDDFLFNELKQILDAYGNHPSFVFMCMGNELKGDPKVLEKWVNWGKKYDNRRLYISNANLEAMGITLPLKGDDIQVAHYGRLGKKRFERRMYPYYNSEKPNTVSDYSYTLKPPYNNFPIISHEVGQWTVYPDFSEINQYTGVLKPRNLEVFKSRLQQKGMLNQANDFLMATGKLASILYKEETERLLRTPNMGGFQLLDLRDYSGQGSALVGLLNPFWESKGFITPNEFKQSCNDITFLLKMPKRVWENNEIFKGQIVVPNYSSRDIEQLPIQWGLYFEDGRIMKKGILNAKSNIQGEVNNIGNIESDFKQITKAEKLTIKLWSAELDISNQYSIWVYPSIDSTKHNESVIIFNKVDDQLKSELENGKKVLLVSNDFDDTEKMVFTTPFWSTQLFSYQAKTMGILCNPSHPVFNLFPTDFHSNWQWWDLTHNTRVLRLNNLAPNYYPLIQVIDHPIRNDKLGAMVEIKVGNGKLLVCTLDILKDLDQRPVARQLKRSILNYMNSKDFNPEENKLLADKLLTRSKNKVVYHSVMASSENSEHPAIFAVDGDLKSRWEAQKQQNTPIELSLSLSKRRYITGVTFIGENAGTGIGKFEIYISDNSKELGNPIIMGDASNQNEFSAIKWDNGFTIQKGKKGKHILLKIENTSGMDKKIVINELQFEFGD